MLDILKDTILDLIKLLPFLFVAFLILEVIEHKISDKSKSIIKKSGKYGPFIGSILGAFPQCGFSVAATNVYAARVITIGTLISIYLSTSDEMLPIMLSRNIELSFILEVILIKIIIGMIVGFVVDYFIRTKLENKEHIHEMCTDDDCHCEKGILLSSIHHTLNIALYIFIFTLILNSAISYLGEENISKILLKGSIFSPFLSSLIGLIPNCAASVVITDLYLNDMLSLGSMIGGLLTGSGVALLILFKVNKSIKENIKIILIIYLVGVISGFILNIFY